MEINKEREAFEEHLAGMKIHNLRVGTIFDTEKNEYFASDVLHPSEDHIVGWINFSWKLWQEKTTPEGFVMVKKELSRKSIRLGLKVLQETDDIEKVFGVMIKAQEQK